MAGLSYTGTQGDWGIRAVVGMTSRWARGRCLVVVVALAMLTGCTGGSGQSSVTPAPSRASGPSGGDPSAASSSAVAGSAMPAPVWEHDQAYSTGKVGSDAVTAHVRLYPLQRIDGHVLLTVDVIPQGPAAGSLSAELFCHTASCTSLADVSLIDPVGRLRYGPLRQDPQSQKGSAAQDGDVVTSRIRQYADVGKVYRLAAFFADPGVDSVDVDLDLSGLALDVPIVAGGSPPAGLVAPAGATVTAPVTGEESGQSLVTWPVVAPGPDAVADRHDVVAPVLGAAVSDSEGGTAGLVSLKSDVLFAFDSATLSEPARAIVAQTVSLLREKADLTRPVTVTGYTDSVGAHAYNVSLSQRRAEAVVAALRGVPTLSAGQWSVSGRGEADPVAPNKTAAGADNPNGRALNAEAGTQAHPDVRECGRVEPDAGRLGGQRPDRRVRPVPGPPRQHRHGGCRRALAAPPRWLHPGPAGRERHP
jgi:OmpA-OmpF porin, OOP family